MAWGPRPRPDPKTYRKGWTSELPAAPKRNMAAEIIEEINELPRCGGHDLAAPEPKPEPPRRIKYPDMGIV